MVDRLLPNSGTDDLSLKFCGGNVHACMIR
jgi:hypothetical protein